MAVLYRPPNSSQDVDYKLQQEIEKSCQKGNVMIIVGDFNMKVDWGNQASTGRQEREFVECLRDGFLEQLVVEPTRGSAVPDWVLCNDPEVIRELKVKEHLGNSDHNMIEFTLKLEKEKLNSDVSVFQWKKGNYNGTRGEPAEVDWKGTLPGRTAEQQWLEFLRKMREVQDKYFPSSSTAFSLDASPVKCYPFSASQNGAGRFDLLAVRDDHPRAGVRLDRIQEASSQAQEASPACLVPTVLFSYA
ncbi:uncharacterized protein LOC132407666 isoform X1 [Hypanus sabinus]|uniref:uncharacterized protein LOC132407666 isoform X1 n=1 Tax=Hypanus sabinus TaxID=79690 RepID=UPI0028C4FDC2|nr:uncharacterized protein LOC132407666 isoform X1 [Hypanus sabinus]